MGKSKVVKIIAERDEIDIMTAEEIVNEAVDMMNEALSEGDYWEIDRILADQLGLEPDYIMDLLDNVY